MQVMGLRMKANGAALLMGIFLMGMVFAEAKLCRTLPVGAVQGRPNVTIWGQETLYASLSTQVTAETCDMNIVVA